MSHNNVETPLTHHDIRPMLAHKFEDASPTKREPPFFVQPKYDGIRAIWYQDKLWSRPHIGPSHKILGVPQVMKELQTYFSGVSLDGELYEHGKGATFERTSGLARRKVNIEKNRLQYWVFDIYSPDSYTSFEKRWFKLLNIFRQLIRDAFIPRWVKLSNCEVVACSREMLDQRMAEIRGQALAQGYEGIILRRPEADYQGKRTWDLLKYKWWQDIEVKAIGFVEGKGKFQGMLGSIQYQMRDGKQGFCGSGMKLNDGTSTLDDAVRLKIWTHTRSYISLSFTLCFQELTANGIPRFPKFKGWR